MRLLVLPRPAAAQTQLRRFRESPGAIATTARGRRGKKTTSTTARGVKKYYQRKATRGSAETLDEGSASSFQEAAAPDMRAEGVVIEVNKKRQQITVRVGDKQTQTLRVLDGAHAASATGARVFVSLSEQAGEKVAYEFTRVP